MLSHRKELAGTALGSLLTLVGSPEPVWAAQLVRPQVVAEYPHDSSAFTQGFLLFEGKFFESTGLYQESSLRRVDPTTGAVEEQINLDPTWFGEGLARIDRELILLTWMNGVAVRYQLDGFAEIERYRYTGEGWGLCYDGTALVMSDGSDHLFFRDPSNFDLLGDVPVRADGQPVRNLNELECVEGMVLANVWQTNTIVRIDPGSGVVSHRIDASGLLTPAEAASADVLNGIAYASTSGRYFITGKLWPKVFEVTFDFGAPPAVDGGAGPPIGGSSSEPGGSGAESDAGVPNGSGESGSGGTDSGGGLEEPGPDGGEAEPKSEGRRKSRGCAVRSSEGATTGNGLLALVIGILVSRRRRTESRA